MILAFDTSNYTTSIAVVKGADIVVDFRQLIDVKLGARGIRQSDGFFMHMQALDKWLTSELEQYVDQLTAIAVSTRPRPVDGSYMPVFRAGEIVANCLASALKLPLYRCSHQEGHLYSALRGQQLTAPFLFLHLSGGTTEVHRTRWQAGNYLLDCVAETADISIGQLIDRIGVKAGLKFPCGAAMDERATDCADFKAPPFRFQPKFNLSGYENYFTQCLAQRPAGAVFYHLFKTAADIVIKIIDNARHATQLNDVLLAGGVAENSIMRRELLSWAEQNDVNIQFASANYAADNAVGVARYAQQMRS